ncbi:MAG: hypothetical protein HYZ53_14950 [Planctomycetes bacterium]|nr:hypothetical protein [Planctomycetota bacterium]
MAVRWPLLWVLFLAFGVPASADDPELGPLRQAVAERACASAAEEIRPARPKEELLVCRLRNDRGGKVTELLRTAIAARGKFAVMEPGLVDSLWRELGLPEDDIKTGEEARRAGSRAGAKAVLLGRLERLTVEEGGNAAIDLRLRILDVETGNGVLVGRYREDLQQGLLSIPHLRAWAYDTALAYRALIWLSILLLLPLFSVLLRRVLDPTAAGVSVLLVLLYTLVDAGAAFLLLAVGLEGLPAGLVCLVAVAVSLFYNLSVGTKIATLEFAAGRSRAGSAA